MRRSNREIQAAGSQVLPLGVSAVAAQATGRDLVPHHEASCSDPEIIESAQSDLTCFILHKSTMQISKRQHFICNEYLEYYINIFS